MNNKQVNKILNYFHKTKPEFDLQRYGKNKVKIYLIFYL